MDMKSAYFMVICMLSFTSLEISIGVHGLKNVEGGLEEILHQCSDFITGLTFARRLCYLSFLVYSCSLDNKGMHGLDQNLSF